MDLLIDIATMAVMHPGGIPLTDLSLVRGDKHPLRITLLDEGTPVTPSGVRPALAIKTSLGKGDLVLAATNLEPVDDALGMAYVGSLSVNTTQLIAAMGDADSIDLIGEVVLISGDGSQSTSSLIRITVRQDIMPADIVPPVDVVVNWEEMVAAALAAQLPDALHNAGMHVTPAGGSTTLASDMTATHRRDVTYYRLPLNHRNIVGHLASTYTINSVTLKANVSSTPVHVEVYKLANGSYRLLGRSLEAITVSNANYDNTWTYPPGLEVRHDDTIMLRLVKTDGADAVLALAITQVLASTPESGADIVDGLVDPQRVINPDYPDIRYLLYVRLGVSYTSGVSVGGVELATKDHFNALTKEVVSTGEQVHQDAQSSHESRDASDTAREQAEEALRLANAAAAAAQAALAAMPQVDEAGNMILAGGMTATTGTINGPLIINNYNGSLANDKRNMIYGEAWFFGMVELRKGTIVRDNVWVESGVIRINSRSSLIATGPATFNAVSAAQCINANGGVNIPLAAGAVTDTAAVNRAHALGLAHTAMMHQTRTYWITSSCTATNGVTINHIAPGCYCEAILTANSRTSVTLPSAGAVAGGNYSKVAGYALPIKFSGGNDGDAFKLSVLIGGSGQFREYPDAGIDGFRLRPVVGSAADITRLVDVTIYYDNGYKARVRELIGIGNPKRYVVRTTLSNLDYNNNSNPCSATYRIVIAQSEIGHGDALAAGVWLMMGGLSNDTIIKLADIRCWDTYHVLYAPVIYLDTQSGLYGGMISAESPTIINGVGGNTYVRFGLEPYQRSWITSITEVPYTDPEQSAE